EQRRGRVQAASGPGHGGKEAPSPAEKRRLDPADELDVVVDRRIERHEAAGVDTQMLARLQLHRDDRAAAVDEAVPRALEALQDETFPAEESGAEALGELDVDVDVSGGAQKRVALAEDGGVLQRHAQNLARIGAAECDARAL